MSEKKPVSLNGVLSDFRSGLDDGQLMAKYGLSAKQLEEVYRRLVESGRLIQAELDARRGLLDVLEFDDDSLQGSPQAGTSKDFMESDRPPLPSSTPSVDSLPPSPANWQKKAAVGIIGGIVLALLSTLVPAIKIPGVEEWVFRVLGPFIALIGLAMQIWGCYYVLKGKGYHGALSILGILSCFGLIIVLALPNWYTTEKTSGFLTALVVGLVALMVLAVLGIILAIAIPYYVSFKRTACDRAASSDVQKLQAAFGQLAKEFGERKLRLDNDAIARVVEGNALQHMVGPHYGFRGSTAKCEVIMRINRDQDKWIIEGTSLKGSRPQGSTSRYVYRATVAEGPDMTATIGTDAANAQNGKSRDWNSYPYGSPGRPEMCYTESIIQEEGPPGNRTFSLRVPKSVPCSKLDQK
ncbi:MAG: hypothetical protein ACLQPD_10845 [Desulfomonilaceae bacterium]